jgi:hypothetical protein
MNEYSPKYISYAKLVKIAKSQHDELEMLERNLRKTEGLLVEEMEKNQKLIEEQDTFASTIDHLTIRYDSLSADYEGLSNELLNRNQELVSLKESHNELVLEKASLFAEQSVQIPDGFVPPCLKCLERSNAESHAETSNAAKENIATTEVGTTTDPSFEDFAAITEESCRLKGLLETGMLRSLKRHQTLCDVLKKPILHKNPQKEGLGFEKKLNVDGSYWTPEQYPRTTWVRGKSKTLEPETLTGYHSPIPVETDESDESNYKIFKQQNGEVFARYVGTNYRTGSPKKQIWVKKCIVENLPVTANLTVQDNSRRGNGCHS